MSVSVIIPTYNGAKKIPKILDALEQQTFIDFEVIVVIDGSEDDTLKLLKNKESKFHLIYINQNNSGRSISRNNGVLNSSKNLILFFDDDVRPAKDCIQIHHDHHLKYPNSILVGSTPEDPLLMHSDIQKYKMHLGKKWYKNFTEGETQLTKANFFLAAANLSMSKHTFEKLDGFDPRLSDAEDFDLGVRALELGVKIFFNYKAISWHDDFITCKSYILRQREYFYARQKLDTLTKKFEHKSNQNKEPLLVKNIIYKLLSNRHTVWLIDNFNIFKVVPTFIRYKLYSLIIWGLATKHPEIKL